mgnify:CR=1 FL=1
MVTMKRRHFVAGLGALWLPSLARAAAPLAAQPFALGVASGRPTPNTVVLWTRLIPDPALEQSWQREAVAVDWEIADDEAAEEPAPAEARP